MNAKFLTYDIFSPKGQEYQKFTSGAQHTPGQRGHHCTDTLRHASTAAEASHGEPQLRVRDFCLRILELSELRQALICLDQKVP